MVIPSAITLARLAALPMIWKLWIEGQLFATFALYCTAVLTDAIDGFVARKLGSASQLGALLDVCVDVLFLVSLLALLGRTQVIPAWGFAPPLAAAIAFLITSGSKGPRYDPIGRHFGGILFALVGVLLITPIGSDGCFLLCYAITALSGVVVLNRLRMGFTCSRGSVGTRTQNESDSAGLRNLPRHARTLQKTTYPSVMSVEHLPRLGDAECVSSRQSQQH